MSLRDEARENAKVAPEGQNGYRVSLDVDEDFEGRWRGETTEDGQFGEQRVFLLWDQFGSRCWIRGSHVSLARKIDDLSPQVGDRVCIYRGEDYQGSQGTGYSYGVSKTSSDDPLPEDDDDAW
jgi:hypothetical protein